MIDLNAEVVGALEIRNRRPRIGVHGVEGFDSEFHPGFLRGGQDRFDSPADLQARLLEALAGMGPRNKDEEGRTKLGGRVR